MALVHLVQTHGVLDVPANNAETQKIIVVYLVYGDYVVKIKVR